MTLKLRPVAETSKLTLSAGVFCSTAENMALLLQVTKHPNERFNGKYQNYKPRCSLRLMRGASSCAHVMLQFSWSPKACQSESSKRFISLDWHCTWQPQAKAMPLFLPLAWGTKAGHGCK